MDKRYRSVKEAVKNGAIRKGTNVLGTVGISVLHFRPGDTKPIYYTYGIDWRDDTDWLEKVNRRFGDYKRRHNYASEAIVEVILWNGN